MPNNYVLLEKIVVPTAGAASVTFANIPQTGYTDLVVKASAQANNSASSSYAFKITYNGNTANYSDKYIRGSGASVSSSSGSSLSSTYLGEIPSTFVTNTFGNVEIYIPNYTGSNNKSFSSDGVTEANSSTAWATLNAGLWSNTSAITSITLSSTVNLAPNSTFYLYGVAKLGTTPAIAPKATGGDIVMTDGTYWYHQFNASGTFTPAVALTTDYLVVAGGGGGCSLASQGNGGGGAGGYRAASGFSVAANTSLTVTIGAGGSGSGNNADNATNGSNSIFSSITSDGGGAGRVAIGNNGGSGGGGGSSGSTNNAGGTATSGQGNNGGAGFYSATSTQRAGGGGGGASAVGGAGTTNNGGNGGNGSASSITGTSVTYAGGGGGGSPAGGGGTGGTGGGGTAYGSSKNGTANTGGGGGADPYNAAGAGGSGVVIVRYLVA